MATLLIQPVLFLPIDDRTNRVPLDMFILDYCNIFTKAILNSLNTVVSKNTNSQHYFKLSHVKQEVQHSPFQAVTMKIYQL